MIVKILETTLASCETREYSSQTGRHTESQNASNWDGHSSGGALVNVIVLFVVKFSQLGRGNLNTFSSNLHSAEQSLSRIFTHSSIRFTVELSSPHNKNTASQKNGITELLHCILPKNELTASMACTKISDLDKQAL